jgi:hypothetical protein
MAKEVKKSASKAKAAGSPKKKSGGGSNEKENLAKELKSLIPKLDEEGLAFLVKQAQVHLYNMQVDALNKTMIRDEERTRKSIAGKNAKPKARSSGDNDFLDIKMSDTGSSYFLLYSNQWISFSKTEIAALAKIALGNDGTDLEIRERVFNWLSRERNDVLYTASFANKFDNKIISLINLLRENFKIKKNR